jgi:hypothetical protein
MLTLNFHGTSSLGYIVATEEPPQHEVAVIVFTADASITPSEDLLSVRRSAFKLKGETMRRLMLLQDTYKNMK